MEQAPTPKLEQEPGQERNLLTNLMETIRAMALIEGPGWIGSQERAEKKMSDQKLTDPQEIENIAHDTLPAALAKLHTTERDESDEEPVRVYTIYGDGGLNRYYVFSDGSVKFSKRNAGSPQDLQKAEELGFEILS